jgi:hypothetical protein
MRERYARSNPVRNDSAIREHEPLALHASDSRHDKGDAVATQQPVSMPNEPPAEIKALIDKVLSGFNNKDSLRFTPALSAPMLSSSTESLRIAGQSRMLRLAGSQTQRSGYTTLVSRKRPSCATGLLTPRSVERTAMSFSPRRSLSVSRVARVAVGLESSPSRSRIKATSGRSCRRLGVA